MGQLKVSDNAATTLAVSITNRASITTIVLTDASKFPVINNGGIGNDWSYATLYDASNNLEIVKVTRRDAASNTLTIVRGAATGVSGVTDASCRVWPSGTSGVACRLIAQSVNDLAALLAPGAIGTNSITDGAVTSSKLAATGVALPNGSTATAQADTDNTSKVATTGWVRSAMAAIASAAGFVSATAIGGAQNYDYATASFGAGYLKFPSWLGGFIIQWGHYLVGSTTNLSFPVAFTDNLFSIAITPEINALNPNWAKQQPRLVYSAGANNKTSILVEVMDETGSWDSYPSYYNWIAIGK